MAWSDSSFFCPPVDFEEQIRALTGGHDGGPADGVGRYVVFCAGSGGWLATCHHAVESGYDAGRTPHAGVSVREGQVISGAECGCRGRWAGRKQRSEVKDGQVTPEGGSLALGEKHMGLASLQSAAWLPLRGLASFGTLWLESSWPSRLLWDEV